MHVMRDHHQNNALYSSVQSQINVFIQKCSLWRRGPDLDQLAHGGFELRGIAALEFSHLGAVLEELHSGQRVHSLLGPQLLLLLRVHLHERHCKHTDAAIKTETTSNKEYPYQLRTPSTAFPEWGSASCNSCTYK